MKAFFICTFCQFPKPKKLKEVTFRQRHKKRYLAEIRYPAADQRPVICAQLV